MLWVSVIPTIAFLLALLVFMLDAKTTFKIGAYSLLVISPLSLYFKGDSLDGLLIYSTAFALAPVMAYIFVLMPLRRYGKRYETCI